MKFSEEPFQDGLVPRMNKIIGETDNIGLFCLTRADVVLEESGRCNPLTTGPASFHIWDEESNLCSCGLDKKPDIFTGDHFVDVPMIAGYHILIEGMPYGFIVYVELIADVIERVIDIFSVILFGVSTDVILPPNCILGFVFVLVIVRFI